MSAAPTSAPAQGIAPIGSMPKTEGITPVSNGQPVTQSDGNDGPQANWESELQLVSSLAKLQELERKIHELRLFLPEGLLDPLLPGKPAPDSPAQLRTELDRVARDRITRIGKFQSEWRSIEMKPVWSQVESRIKEANGQLIQPSCMWEKDYDVILKGLVEKEKMKEVERGREKDQTERSNLQTSQGEWGAIIEKFSQRNLPGVRVIKREEPLSLTAVLTKAGIVFLVKGVKESDTSGVPEWQVSSQAPAGRSLTKLEQAVQDCLNSRKKKWDLSFLLDMISSYADIKQTPCAKCNRLANDVAQLPAIRRFSSMQSSQNDQQIPKFDALHATCA